MRGKWLDGPVCSPTLHLLENALFPQIRMVRVRLYNGLPVVWRTDPTVVPSPDDGTL